MEKPSLKTVAERKTYLDQIERDIEAVTLSGADAIRVMQGEIEQLEKEKARLMKIILDLEQTIRENRILAES